MPQDMRRNNQNERATEDIARISNIIARISIALDPEKDPDGKELFYCAEESGKFMAEKGVTATQVRKFYSKARQIKFRENDKNAANEVMYELRMLKAIISYTAGRFSKSKDDPLHKMKDILSKAIDEAINDKMKFDKKRFERLENFFEAIVAYHRSYGGKEL